MCPEIESERRERGGGERETETETEKETTHKQEVEAGEDLTRRQETRVFQKSKNDCMCTHDKTSSDMRQSFLFFGC